jgi:hypothetical protein
MAPYKSCSTPIPRWRIWPSIVRFKMSVAPSLTGIGYSGASGGAHWRVLLNYLILFGFVYPAKQSCILTWVIQDLLDRLQHEVHHLAPTDQLCQGTFLSRAQYLVDIECWGYCDAWLKPTGLMTVADMAHWTAAISEEERAL